MLRVFLVEDESIIRETLRDTVPWSRLGYTFVGEAADGEMALPLIRNTRPDVLITDIRMPFMDGLSLSKLVMEERPDIKIIILSGYDDFEYAQQAIKIGVEQYLLKPITKATLVHVLQEVQEKSSMNGNSIVTSAVFSRILRNMSSLPDVTLWSVWWREDLQFLRSMKNPPNWDWTCWHKAIAWHFSPLSGKITPNRMPRCARRCWDYL